MSLINPQGNDSIESRRVINGPSTGINNFNKVKYQWAVNLWDAMLNNHWTDQDISFAADAAQYKLLSAPQSRSYNLTTGFLVFLDSLNTYNPALLKTRITAPEIAVLFDLQSKEEAIHSKSYGNNIEAVIPPNEREEIYDFWRSDPVLFDRIKKLTRYFEEYAEDMKDDKKFFKALIAMYLLEGLFFYVGFTFFYSLSGNGLMQNTADNIKEINKDEITHCLMVAEILKELRKEEPELFDEDIIIDMFKEAVELEIKWSTYALDKNVGFSQRNIEQYVKTLANRRLSMIKIKPIYKNVSNPFRSIESLSGRIELDNGTIEGSTLKGNFFTSKVTDYKQAAFVKGWDEIVAIRPIARR